jgi:hypothetical protein
MGCQWPLEFGAEDVADLFGREEEEPSDDAVDVLYEFLFPREPRRKVSAASVGRRLAKHIDNPVSNGERTLALRRYRDLHTKSWRYYVEDSATKPAAAP